MEKSGRVERKHRSKRNANYLKSFLRSLPPDHLTGKRDERWSVGGSRLRGRGKERIPEEGGGVVGKRAQDHFSLSVLALAVTCPCLH